MTRHSVKYVSLTVIPGNTATTIHVALDVGKTTVQIPAPNRVTLLPYVLYVIVANLLTENTVNILPLIILYLYDKFFSNKNY